MSDRPETPDEFFASVKGLVEKDRWADAVIKLTMEILSLHARIAKLERSSASQYQDTHEAGYNPYRR